MSSADSLRRLRRALETLPEELNDTYDQAMERIQCQKRSKTDLANKVLSWVVFARRPVTIEELRCALAVEPGDSDLDEEGLPDPGYLLSVCGGLVMINGDTENVRFIHYTVQEYFERARHPQSSSAHTYLATTCISYLSFSTHATGILQHTYYETGQKLFDCHVLLGYASRHWGDHVRECCDQDSTIHATVRLFLTRKANVSCSLAVWYRERSFGIFKPFSCSNVTDLHVAATFGLDWLAEEFLQQGASVDAQDFAGRTPLHEAGAGGHTNVVRSLLERGANPILKNQRGEDAMVLAARAGHEPATRLFLQESLSPNMEEVIIRVVQGGHLGVLRLILESLKHTTKIKKADYVGTALRYATLLENEACIRLILEEVEDLEMSELQSHLDNALCSSLQNDNFVITTLLLDRGADPTEGLHSAAELRDIAGVRHMLDRGTKIEAVNWEGDGPMHLSLRSPNKLERMLKLLLERGADIDAYGSDKKTPLMTVAKLGYADLVQYLLHNGADILAKDGKFNRPAIEWAVLGGHLHVVQLLLNYQRPADTGKGLIALTRLYQELRHLDTNEVDSSAAQHGEDSDYVNSESEVDDESSDDLNPEPRSYDQLLSDINTLPPEDLKRLLLLHHPAKKGDETIVRDFVNMGADVEALDDRGETALHAAAVHDHTNTMRLLLDHGAMVDPQEGCNPARTTLSVAISNGNYDSVQLLIKEGADMDRDSEEYGTPLMEAVCWSYNEKIVRLLLESGADPNMETAFGHGGNALHRAVFRPFLFDSDILRLLIAKGGNLEAKDHDGRTPLLLAVGLGRIDMVSLLLELGADPTSVENDTMPSFYTIEEDFETAMQLIGDAKQRWIKGARSNSPSPNINRPGTKRRISRISD